MRRIRVKSYKKQDGVLVRSHERTVKTVSHKEGAGVKPGPILEVDSGSIPPLKKQTNHNVYKRIRLEYEPSRRKILDKFQSRVDAATRMKYTAAGFWVLGRYRGQHAL